MERNWKGKLSKCETKGKDRKAFQLFQGGKERIAVQNNWTDDHVWYFRSVFFEGYSEYICFLNFLIVLKFLGIFF